jgi:hypothetical protein
MSKRDLKKYLFDLNKEQLEKQIMELYDKFKEVKIYYDFAFNTILNGGKMSLENYEKEQERIRLEEEETEKDSFLWFCFFSLRCALSSTARRKKVEKKKRIFFSCTKENHK